MAMRTLLLIVFAALFVGGAAMALIELFYTEKKGPEKYGDIHGNTSGRPRVLGYVAVGILGFIAMLIELAIIY